MSMNMKKETVAQFLLRRLHEAGCDHIFGVPGDFVLGFMNNILTSDIKLVCTCNELNAAYAADSYARIKGIGAVCTTYVVGELSAINGVAGAYAENVPVVKITGAPARQHYLNHTLLHHTLGDYKIPERIFGEITSATAVLNNTATVVHDVDRVLRVCLTKHSPVYISICADIVEEIIDDTPVEPFKLRPVALSAPCALDAAVDEAVQLLSNAKSPIIVPGVDIIRMSLQNDVKLLIEKSGMPFVTMMLAKSVIDEEHPQYIGLYQGRRSRQSVADRVKQADCRLALGVKMTDFNTGGFSTDLDQKYRIFCSRDYVDIGYKTYKNVHIGEFIKKLTEKLPQRNSKDFNIVSATEGCVHRRTVNFIPNPESKLLISRVFDRVAHFLQPNCVFIAETGASMFSATEVMLPKGSCFMAQCFYGSIGFSVGAVLGACIAAPNRRVVAFIGDGSFQVTAQDLSTMIRYGCKPLIFLINNDGYLIERVIVDRSYNDIQPWKYHKLLEVFGGGRSFDVHTESQFEEVLEAATSCDDLIFAELHLGKWDCNESLRAAGRQMAINNRLLSDEEICVAIKRDQ